MTPLNTPPWALHNAYFGLELETTLLTSRGIAILRDSKVPLRKPGKSIYGGWGVEYDTGAEFVSPKLRPRDIGQVRRVIEALQNAGAMRSTQSDNRGLHVHVDATGMTADTLLQIIHLFSEHENVLFRMMGSRHGRVSTCCKPMPPAFLTALAETRPKTMEGIVAAWTEHGCGRQCALNLEALQKHGTLEFRLFRASVDPQYVESSIAIAHRMLGIAQERGVFEQWDDLAKLGRSKDPNTVLDALRFSTSSQGLSTMRRQLMERHGVYDTFGDATGEECIILSEDDRMKLLLDALQHPASAQSSAPAKDEDDIVSLSKEWIRGEVLTVSTCPRAPLEDVVDHIHQVLGVAHTLDRYDAYNWALVATEQTPEDLRSMSAFITRIAALALPMDSVRLEDFGHTVRSMPAAERASAATFLESVIRAPVPIDQIEQVLRSVDR